MSKNLGTELVSITMRNGPKEDTSPLRMVSEDYMKQAERRNRAIQEMFRSLVRPEGQYDGLQPLT